MTISRSEMPDDDTAEVLLSLQSDGIDLAKPLKVDFHVAVPNAEAGAKLQECVIILGYVTALVEDKPGREWTLWCSKTIVPTHGAITDCENELNDIARRVGGYIDGWGAFGG